MRDPLLKQFVAECFPLSVSRMESYFSHASFVRAARAPARLDVMGGIADYSGALVLQYPLAHGAVAGVQTMHDGRVAVASFPACDSDPNGAGVREHHLEADQFARLREASYDEARRIFQESAPPWVAYLIGPVLVLLREHSPDWRGGLRIALCSNAPEGKGIASSAAVETAVFAAGAAALGCDVSGHEAARLCQIAENRIVGAPCGIMDQMVSALGRKDRLLALLCQPAEVVGYVEIPKGLALFGIDSGIRHAVCGSDYTSVRVGAFMGLRMLSALANGSDSAPWNGYLANVGVAAFEKELGRHLPERISGEAFLNQHGDTTDPVTKVDPKREYAVLKPTAHPIYEHARIRRFASLLEASAEDQHARVEMGRLMFESHASYSACGLGSEGTDRLVDAVREAGPQSGLFGAKITGGGSGGTVAVLARSEAAAEVARIARDYAAQTGRGGTLFQGSSPGAFSGE